MDNQNRFWSYAARSALRMYKGLLNISPRLIYPLLKIVGAYCFAYICLSLCLSVNRRSVCMSVERLAGRSNGFSSIT